MKKIKEKTVKEKTESEILEEKIEREARSLKDVRDKYISEPNVFYKVGQRVQYGCINESIISEVIDGGKIYKIKTVHIDTNYGNPIEKKSDMHVCWHDISPYFTRDEIMKTSVFHKDQDLRIQYFNCCINSVLSRHYNFGIDFNPDYQRGNVWDLSDKIKLIHSIFNDIEIGKLAFISLPFKKNSPSYEILDGKQRVNALIEFYEGRFAYEGKFYRDLHPHDKNHFCSFPVSIGEIKEHIKDSQKYKYFLKLNVSGKPQDKDHIKKVEEMYKEALKKEQKGE